jgi:hypothetical protein
VEAVEEGTPPGVRLLPGGATEEGRLIADTTLSPPEAMTLSSIEECCVYGERGGCRVRERVMYSDQSSQQTPTDFWANNYPPANPPSSIAAVIMSVGQGVEQGVCGMYYEAPQEPAGSNLLNRARQAFPNMQTTALSPHHAHNPAKRHFLRTVLSSSSISKRCL